MNISLPIPQKVTDGIYTDYMLIKFTSSKDFQRDFLDGKLYFNNSDFFSNCDNKGQGDENEGANFIYDPRKPSLMSPILRFENGKALVEVIDYTNQPENYEPGTVLSLSTTENRYRKIICLYTAYLNSSTNEISPFSNKMADEFGEFGILILDKQEFLHRVCRAIANREDISKPYMGFVDYLNEEESAQGFIDWDPFKKMPKFEYQNEFRITFVNNTTDPLKLDLGDLRDIAVPITASNLEDMYLEKTTLHYTYLAE